MVSEQVLRSSNPVARFGRKLSDSVGGIFFGLILIAAGFGLVWFGEQQKEYSKAVAALPLITSVAAGQTGMMKIQAPPVVTQPLVSPITQQPVLYFEYKKQEFKKVKEMRTETRTIQRDGQDVQQTFEKEVLVDKWVDVSSNNKWGGFTVGGVLVNGTNASLSYLDLKTLYEKEAPTTGATEDPADMPINAVQKIREIVYGIPAATTLLVVGNVQAGAIASGEPFLITDKTNEALLSAMETSESRMYWGLKIAAWLIMTIGFIMLFGPITTFLNILPGLGKAVGGILFLVFGVVSAIFVLLGTIVIRYWWAVLIILIIGIVFAVTKLRGRSAAA